MLEKGSGQLNSSLVSVGGPVVAHFNWWGVLIVEVDFDVVCS